MLGGAKNTEGSGWKAEKLDQESRVLRGRVRRSGGRMTTGEQNAAAPSEPGPWAVAALTSLSELRSRHADLTCLRS